MCACVYVCVGRVKHVQPNPITCCVVFHSHTALAVLILTRSEHLEIWSMDPLKTEPSGHL